MRLDELRLSGFPGVVRNDAFDFDFGTIEIDEEADR
jgi:hypothetical protein